jgi:DNA polymerase-3 subunit gamma/tau
MVPVASEDAAAAFTLAGRAVELGYDLRAVCRELTRVVRDLLVLSVDPSRLGDPEIAGEGERDRVQALVRGFSREDLLRAFDLLTRAETDMRSAAQPRFHLEMALLRWIYLRKLTPIEDLLSGAGSKTPTPSPAARPDVKSPRPEVKAVTAPPSAPATAAASGVSRPQPKPQAVIESAAGGSTGNLGNTKDALLAEIRKNKPVFYNMVVAQAQKIEVAADRVTFTFSANQRALKDQFEQLRGWLESIAQQASGRTLGVAGLVAEAPEPAGGTAAKTPEAKDRKSVLREQALADAGVQTMLEVFPAEIRDVEEM